MDTINPVQIILMQFDKLICALDQLVKLGPPAWQDVHTRVSTACCSTNLITHNGVARPSHSPLVLFDQPEWRTRDQITKAHIPLEAFRLHNKNEFERFTGTGHEKLHKHQHAHTLIQNSKQACKDAAQSLLLLPAFQSFQRIGIHIHPRKKSDEPLVHILFDGKFLIKENELNPSVPWSKMRSCLEKHLHDWATVSSPPTQQWMVAKKTELADTKDKTQNFSQTLVTIIQAGTKEDALTTYLLRSKFESHGLIVHDPKDLFLAHIPFNLIEE